MRARAVFALSALAATLASAGQVCGQTDLENIDHDRTFWLPKGDPDMAAAMRKARETLPQFLALARNPPASASNFAVKVGVHAKDRDIVEYFWVGNFVEKNGRFSGRIDNDPDTVNTVKLGDTISFGRDEIVAWIYLDGRRLKGNYTLCVMLRRSPAEEAQAVVRKYGIDCNF
jgi:uncharacterized protein YegJ (DUF2314 family)